MSMTFGLIIGNRSIFPRKLVKQGRDDILEVLIALGHKPIVLSEEDSQYGSVENFADAKKCAELLRKHADEIDGIIVTLPNFGDEKSVANAIRLSGLNVPVLIQAEPDDPERMKVGERRDSFCGKISTCANLHQYGIPYTLTRTHTCSVKGDQFKDEIDNFAAVCRVVNGLRGARLGAIGTRPAAFNTVRYSEKILERAGISVETLDLSEVIGQAKAMEVDEAVTRRVEGISAYTDTGTIPVESLEKIAKLAIVVERWVEANDLDAIAFQCWTAIEEYLGVVPCTVLSILTNGLIPAACEVDVTGALSMLALQLISGTPAAILDWNNNFGDSLDKAVVFHCSSLPADLLTNPKMGVHFSESLKPGYGVLLGRIPPGPFTFLRVSTSDETGDLTFYAGEGKFTDDPLETFGGYGVIEVINLQGLLRGVCIAGLEHHFALTRGKVAQILREAFVGYLSITPIEAATHLSGVGRPSGPCLARVSSHVKTVGKTQHNTGQTISQKSTS
jgi:L-fucose isomerase-like protein